MMICARKASVQKSKISALVGQHKTPSLRCFPVQVGRFHTGGLLNQFAVGFCFDAPGQGLSPNLFFARWNTGGLG